MHVSFSTGRLPALRQELGLYPAPAGPDGSPAWSLHDPCGNRFFQLTWPSFEILSRWHLGDAGAVLAAIKRETTLALDERDLHAFAVFLEKNHLVEAKTPEDGKRLLAAHGARRMGPFLWLVKNYLFFRIPLVRPEAFLKKLAPWAGWAFGPAFFAMLAFLTTLSLVLVIRHWESFIHGFGAFRSLGGILSLFVAIPIAKAAHELGHASAAHHHGCKVPVMGIAFVVLAPMLYTDTNEAWKLSSRRRRFAVAAAGVLAETALAAAACVAWFFLPDGVFRNAAFILATTTLMMTLLLNVSPFMRFDGYFLLCDLLNMPNLHQRAFAFGLWKVRQWLFGFDDPPPEPASATRRCFLILFSFAVWAYRFALFLGIALLVYHFFFKALGVILFTVEIVWFIALPIWRELSVWWRRRSAIRMQWATLRTALLAGGLAALALLPWQRSIRAPAMLGPAREQQIVASHAGLVVAPPVIEGTGVEKDEEVGRLFSPQLAERLAKAKTSEAVSRWQVDRQVFAEHLLHQGQVIQRQWEGNAGALANLREEEELLLVRAPFSGTVIARNDELMEKGWVADKEWLLTVADLGGNRVDAYVGEADLRRLTIGAAARFIPDAVEYGVYSCRIGAIDEMNLAVLDEPALASSYGGPIPAHIGAEGAAIPAAPLFRVRLDTCSPAKVPPLRLRGTAHIEAAGQSPFKNILRHAAAVFRRESGL